jgi:NitT/TauT family transport system ATP-binding protein
MTVHPVKHREESMAHSSDDDIVIDVRDVSVRFGQQTAVDRLNLEIRAGERVAILGQTGAGKSTLLSLLVGSLKPTSGSVRVSDRDPVESGNALRGTMAMVFQQPSLIPWRTALGNVEVGLQIMGRSRAQRRSRAQEWLTRVHLSGAEAKYPVQLSGGMRQRVALARAFVTEPQLLLLDESLSALDEVTADSLRKDIIELADATGTTAVIVTHNIAEAFAMAHRVLVLAKPAQIVAEYDTSTVDLEDAVAFVQLRRDVHALMAGRPEERSDSLRGR